MSNIPDSTTSSVLFEAFGSTNTPVATFSGVPTGPDYDPYGNLSQTLAPLTNTQFGGKFYNTDIGLYLTQQHSYDPITVRWLSSQPSSLAANLYWYVYDNPVSLTDPTGEGSLGNFIRACGIVIGLTAGGQAVGAKPPEYPPPPVIQIQAGQGPKPK